MCVRSLSEVILLGPQYIKVYELSVIDHTGSCGDSCMQMKRNTRSMDLQWENTANFPLRLFQFVLSHQKSQLYTERQWLWNSEALGTSCLLILSLSLRNKWWAQEEGARANVNELKGALHTVTIWEITLCSYVSLGFSGPQTNARRQIPHALWEQNGSVLLLGDRFLKSHTNTWSI